MIYTGKSIRMWYLSGGMTKFGKEEFNKSNDWRLKLQHYFSTVSERSVICFSPNDHFNMMSDTSTFTDREAMNIDIYKLHQSELIIYNNNDPFSRGSMIELGIGYEMGLPIITLNDASNEVHPWVRDMSIRVCTSMDELIDYLTDHFLCKN